MRHMPHFFKIHMKLINREIQYSLISQSIITYEKLNSTFLF